MKVSVVSDMIRKINVGITNNEKGLFLSINGQKYYFSHDTQICGLLRSIIIDPISSAEITIKARGAKPGILYNKHNENTIKSSVPAEEYIKYADDYDVLDYNKATIKKEMMQHNKELKQQRIAEEKKKAYKDGLDSNISIVEENNNKHIKVNAVNIASELSKLKCNVKPVIIDSIVQEVNNATVKEVEVKPHVTIKSEKPVIVREVVKAKPLTDLVSKELVRQEVIDNNSELVTLYRQYSEICKKYGVEKVSRDIARKEHIRYAKYFNDVYSDFIAAYNAWKN